MSIKDSERAGIGVIGYADEYLVEEDEIGDSLSQANLMHYLGDVVRWMYRHEGWLVALNFNHYHPSIENSQKLIVPDVAVFKGIPISSYDQLNLPSWNMRGTGKLPPPVVIEVSSDNTYQNDIEPERKPRVYGLVGVREYFAYEPNEERRWPQSISTRILGWRYAEGGKAEPMEPDNEGRLWSEVLESWLVEDGSYLRLYDREGQLRLTAAEAKEAARKVADAARKVAEAQAEAEMEARTVAEARAVEAERRLAELEARLKRPDEPA